MASWEVIKLEELAADEPNSFVDGPFGSSLKADEYTNEGVPIIRLQNIRPNKFISKKIKFISARKAEELSRHSYKPGDLVIAKLGDPCGMACVLPKEAGEGRIVADVVRFRGQPDRVDHQFLSYYINSPIGRAAIDRDAKGATRQRVNLSNFKALKIPLPPLPEQRRIAAILDKAEALRAARREALAQLDELTQSIFIEMFGDPVANSKRLPVANLEDLCKRVTDGTHQSPKWESEGIPFLFISNIVNGEINYDTDKFISHETYNELTRRCPIQVGDVLFTIVGSYGNTAVVAGDRMFCFQRHIAHIKPNEEKLDPQFCAAMLQSSGVRRQVDKAARGVAQKTVNLADLKTLRVFAPPLDMQKNFTARLEVLKTIKGLQGQALRETDTAFSSLQHRAFRGEL